MGAPVNIMVGDMGPIAPMSQYPQTPTVPNPGGSGVAASASIIDGTPLRVVSVVALAIGGLAGLRWAGIKFNVTVG